MKEEELNEEDVRPLSEESLSDDEEMK